jgi:hypothetical protein
MDERPLFEEKSFISNDAERADERNQRQVMSVERFSQRRLEIGPLVSERWAAAGAGLSLDLAMPAARRVSLWGKICSP